MSLRGASAKPAPQRWGLLSRLLSEVSCVHGVRLRGLVIGTMLVLVGRGRSHSPPPSPVISRTGLCQARAYALLAAPTATAPVVVPAPAFATGNSQLDAAAALPGLLFGWGRRSATAEPARCAATPADTTRPERGCGSARRSHTPARLTCAASARLGHSVHMDCSRGGAHLGCGGRARRAGRALGRLREVADCVAWILAPTGERHHVLVSRPVAQPGARRRG
jgi:hypothetical protein